ncbi:MAG TPA: hypothetical protein VH208_11990 [Myxococcaceae bacterium]|jgi:hypothetical protein|nr:hypothetical protein [Myxococcaceae bacterium]
MKVTVSPSKAGWVVRIASASGRIQYEYASRSQARFFAAVFRLQPRILPQAHRFAPATGARAPN